MVDALTRSSTLYPYPTPELLPPCISLLLSLSPLRISLPHRHKPTLLLQLFCCATLELPPHTQAFKFHRRGVRTSWFSVTGVTQVLGHKVKLLVTTRETLGQNQVVGLGSLWDHQVVGGSQFLWKRDLSFAVFLGTGVWAWFCGTKVLRVGSWWFCLWKEIGFWGCCWFRGRVRIKQCCVWVGFLWGRAKSLSFSQTEWWFRCCGNQAVLGGQWVFLETSFVSVSFVGNRWVLGW